VLRGCSERVSAVQISLIPWENTGNFIEIGLIGARLKLNLALAAT
jgi:hypothetical protein